MSDYPRMSENDPPTVPVQPEGFVTQDPYTSESVLGSSDTFAVTETAYTTSYGQSDQESSSTAQQAKAEAGHVASTAAEQGQQVAGEAKAQVGQVAEEAKAQVGKVASEAGGQVKHLANQAKDEITSQAGQQKARAAEGIRGFSGQLSGMASGSPQEGVAMDLVNQASQRIESIASWIENREPADLLEDVRGFARQRPGIFLAGAAVAGLLAGRMTKGLRADAGPSSSTGSPSNAMIGQTTAMTTVATPVEPYPTTPAPGWQAPSAAMPDLEPRHLAGEIPSTTVHLGDEEALAGKRAEESRGQAGQW